MIYKSYMYSMTHNQPWGLAQVEYSDAIMGSWGVEEYVIRQWIIWFEVLILALY